MAAAAPSHLEARSRWSSAAKCSRQGAYGLLGVEPGETDDRTRRLWVRGKQLGAYVADSFAAKYGEQNIVREKAVPWPAGILHQDVFVIPERAAVEVKSTNSPASILDAALMQLAGEVHFDPDADHGLLVLVNPSDLEMEFVPFVLNDEWVERVEKTADEVMRAGASRGQTLPERVCGKPSDGRGRFCPFIEHCFEGWVPPEVEPVTDPAIIELVGEWIAAKQEYRRHKGDEETAHETYKEVEAKLNEYGFQAGRDYQAGPYVFRRISVKGRETFQLARARKSGMWTPGDDDRFADFVTIGEPSERYDAHRDGGNIVEADFGDVPF
jgi:hypothetical protein